MGAKINKLIGILPASGSATRLRGIPKFCLPINDLGSTLIEWHVNQMQEVCDEVRICTNANWIPLLKAMDFSSSVTLLEIEPSTMSDAIMKLIGDNEDSYLVGMPDTYICYSEENHYSGLSKSNSDIALSLFTCPNELVGHVGQVLLDSSGKVVASADKVDSCDYPYLWGAMFLRNIYLNPTLLSPGLEIQKWIDEGRIIEARITSGLYVDAGTFAGLKTLYSMP